MASAHRDFGPGPGRRIAARLLLALAVTLLAPGPVLWADDGAQPSGKLVVYTSIRGTQIKNLVKAFEREHPKVEVVVFGAGAKRLMSKLAVERERGQNRADVLLTTEAADFVKLCENRFLMSYAPREEDRLIPQARSEDDCYHFARYTIIGLAVSLDLAAPPRAWGDLALPELRDAFAFANPVQSGTSFVSVALLSKTFGWDYFARLKANGAILGDDVSESLGYLVSGKRKICMIPDYLAREKIQAGAPLTFIVPPEVIALPSPVAILRDAKNPEAAKHFVDFILSRPGQEIIAAAGSMPVRRDAALPAGSPLPSLDDMQRRAIAIDFDKIADDSYDILATFRRNFSEK